HGHIGHDVLDALAAALATATTSVFGGPSITTVDGVRPLVCAANVLRVARQVIGRHGRIPRAGLVDLHRLAIEVLVGKQLGRLFEIHDGEPELVVVLVDAGAAA